MIHKYILLLLLVNHLSKLNCELLRAPQQPHFDYAFTKFRPPPPPPEPSFMQRVTSWIFPWGWSTEEEQLSIPAMPKIDSLPPPPGPPPSLPVQYPQTRVMNTYPVRDTEPTTPRTTRMAVTKCSPCNKVPWIPMIPTYQMPVVKGNQQQPQQQQLSFKHHFGNENPYAQVPSNNNLGYKYTPPTTTASTVYGVPGYSYNPPSTTTRPTKLQENQHEIYGVPPSYSASPPQQNINQVYGPPSFSSTTSRPPPIKLQQFSNVQQIYGIPSTTPKLLSTPITSYHYSSPLPAFPPSTTPRINVNTIDTSVITFTTNRPQNNRPLRFTSPQGAVTNSEYLPPPNVLPLEGENAGFPAPIPIPNLSPTPIPPLFDAKPFHDNPYTNQKVGYIKLVPLEPVAQLSSKVNVHVKPSNGIEVLNSNLIAEFTIPPKVTENAPTKIKIDIGNNLDNFNTTLSAPILVASAETTDAAFAASEKEYHHNVHQELDDDNDVEQLKFDDRVQSNNVEQTTTTEVEETTTTTTVSNYDVKLEPSIQTAAELAKDETRKKNFTNYKIRERETPLEMLDSPILHKSTVKPTIPPFKPMEDYSKTLATLWTAATRSLATTTATSKSSMSSTSRPTIHSFIAKLSGIALQKEPSNENLTKKPKQIVIPYTTINRPSPFKSQNEQDFATYKPFLRGHYVTHPPRNKSEPILSTTTSKNDLYNAHGYHNDEEYQLAQESQIVESKVKLETNRHLTKIIANNIRDLLKREKTPKPSKIDVIKLQRNIDGWTEQSFKGKASTMVYGHTKAIPSSFLTTTMRLEEYPVTTLSPMTTFDPDLMEETRKQYETILYKNEDEEDELYVKRHDRFLSRDNELVLLNNNLTQNSMKHGVKVYAPKATLSPGELWQRLHVTVSPLTNERVYVVTPQSVAKREIGDLKTTSVYKPRFAIRPTIAGIRKKISRRVDGQDDIEFVDTINGQPKALKIVTPERSSVTKSIESSTTEANN